MQKYLHFVAKTSFEIFYISTNGEYGTFSGCSLARFNYCNKFVKGI